MSWIVEMIAKIVEDGLIIAEETIQKRQIGDSIAQAWYDITLRRQIIDTSYELEVDYIESSAENDIEASRRMQRMWLTLLAVLALVIVTGVVIIRIVKKEVDS